MIVIAQALQQLKANSELKPICETCTLHVLEISNLASRGPSSFTCRFLSRKDCKWFKLVCYVKWRRNSAADMCCLLLNARFCQSRRAIPEAYHSRAASAISSIILFILLLSSSELRWSITHLYISESWIESSIVHHSNWRWLDTWRTSFFRRQHIRKIQIFWSFSLYRWLRRTWHIGQFFQRWRYGILQLYHIHIPVAIIDNFFGLTSSWAMSSFVRIYNKL